VPQRTVVRGERFRGEQSVGAVATDMVRIDLSQFGEPVPERLHGRLLLWGNNGDTTVTGPRRRPVAQAPFVPSSATPLIPDPRACPRPAGRQDFFGGHFTLETSVVMWQMIFL
jgi:hypothetical protein